jgi:predicted ATPase
VPTPTLKDARKFSAREALGFGAIALFVERAQAIDHRFALTDENAPTVADICTRLDGIPLAIELAAARVGVLPLKMLSAKVDQRLAILSAGDRRAIPRQKTMRALIDCSYDLLSPAEQRLFEKLSLFVRGCTLAAATGVCGDDGFEELDILDILASLVDKSLVLADLEGDEPRYVLLESFREYAHEKLVLRGELANVVRRHALTYYDVAERIDRATDFEPEPTWLAEIERS